VLVKKPLPSADQSKRIGIVCVRKIISGIVRPGTKNLVVAAEKSFKTTMLMRLGMGMACGYTVYPSLPVVRPVRVLYIHGEMNPKELAERRTAAAASIPPEAIAIGENNFIDGRSIDAHLIKPSGQDEIRKWVSKFHPEVLFVDPWQSFIPGFDENSFKEVSQALCFLDMLAVEQSGMTIIMALHLGKDHTKGERGHSSLKGWRDTLIELKAKDGKTAEVKVSPRWGEPITLKLKFENGTMFEVPRFTPQTTKIREFVVGQKKAVSREEIEVFLKVSKEAAKKAIRRAVGEEAIMMIAFGEHAGKFAAFVEKDEASVNKVTNPLEGL
jgi:RecA-family ATPase